MFVLVITFIAHLVASYLINYCFDQPTLHIRNGENTLLLPSLTDLIEREEEIINSTDSEDEIARKNRVNDLISLENKIQREKYVCEVISPAYNYFKTIKELESYQDKRSAFILMIITMPSSVILIICSLSRILPDIASWWGYIILLVIVPIAICTLCDWIISRIYKFSRHNIPKFEIDVERYISSDFNLPVDNHVNNYIIRTHNRYIESLKNTTIFRSNVLSVAEPVFLIFFGLMIAII